MAHQLMIMIRTFMKYWREFSLLLSFFALLSWGDKRHQLTIKRHQSNKWAKEIIFVHLVIIE